MPELRQQHGLLIEKRLTDFFLRSQRVQSWGIAWRQAFFSLLIVALHLVAFFYAPRLQRFEYPFLDAFFRARPFSKPDPAIALIEIGDESLQAIGRWPWPRAYHASMIRLLEKWEAAAIVYDVPFPESAGPEDTAALEQAVAESRHLYLPVPLEEKKEKKIWVHSLPVVLEPAGEGKTWIYPPPEFKEHLKGTGHHEIFQDRDGVVRRVVPFLANASEVYPDLALVAAYDYQGRPLPSPYDWDGVNAEEKRIFINWAGPWEKAFTRYEFSDLIRSEQDLQKTTGSLIGPESVKGRICFVGVTAKNRAL